jgi:hypothetical protein
VADFSEESFFSTLNTIKAAPASIFPVVTIPAIILLNRKLNAEKKE